MNGSIARRLAELTGEQRLAVLAALSPEEQTALQYCWEAWARPDQLPPEGEWRTWLLLGGRGSGKTRAAAGWVRAEMEVGRRHRWAFCFALLVSVTWLLRGDAVGGGGGLFINYSRSFTTGDTRNSASMRWKGSGCEPDDDNRAASLRRPHMIKPGSKDEKVSLLIAGEELRRGVFASVTRRRAREALTDAQQRLRRNAESCERAPAARLP